MRHFGTRGFAIARQIIRASMVQALRPINSQLISPHDQTRRLPETA
jgi:hypothetical protein